MKRVRCKCIGRIVDAADILWMSFLSVLVAFAPYMPPLRCVGRRHAVDVAVAPRTSTLVSRSRAMHGSSTFHTRWLSVCRSTSLCEIEVLRAAMFSSSG